MGGWSTPLSGRLPSAKRPVTHYTGGCVGPRAGLDGCEKSCPPPGFDHRTVQPVANRCIDYDMAADSCSKAWGKPWNIKGTSMDFGFSSFREFLGSFLGLRQAILTDRFLSFSPPLQTNSVVEPQRHRPPPHTSFQITGRLCPVLRVVCTRRVWKVKIHHV